MNTLRTQKLINQFESLNAESVDQLINLYADDALRTAKPISLSVRNEKLENVLALCFRDQLLSYTISDKTIVVKRKYAEPTIVAAIEPEAVAPPDIKGKVTDNNGAPLPIVS